MATLKDLARRMRAKADHIDEVMQNRRGKVATAILKYLIEATPVDTSRALSNWRVSTAGAVGMWIEAHSIGSKGSTRAASAAQALAEGEAAILAGNTAQALVIFNSVPYIRRLNEGSSAQAPAGFVEKAILAGRLAARGQ